MLAKQPRCQCHGRSLGLFRACRSSRSVRRARKATAAATASAEAAAAATTEAARSPVLFEEVTEARAFLPADDPLVRLPSTLQAYEDALADVPSLAMGGPGTLRRALELLPPFDLQQLPAMAAVAEQQPQILPPAGSCYAAAQSNGGSSSSSSSCDAEIWRAYFVLSFLSHAYLWCDRCPDVPSVLPAVLAKPWAAVSAAVGMPPVLVYATYNLMNWRRLDVSKPLELGNIACQHNFLGGVDEQWFRLIHVAIEAAAAPGIAALQPLQQAAAKRDAAAMELHLSTIASCLQACQQLLARMGEGCDPYIYYRRVRLPMAGWRNNPALPEGLLYEGVWPQPQPLYGETGAQSTVVPAIDAVLGVQHECGWLRGYLVDMRAHMPPAHRAFLHKLEAGPSVRQAVQELAATPSSSRDLLEAYNSALNELESFRTQHRGFAKAYIAQFSQRVVGTGGSDFMPALTAYRNTTAAHRLSGSGVSS